MSRIGTGRRLLSQQPQESCQPSAEHTPGGPTRFTPAGFTRSSNETSVFRRLLWLILPHFAATSWTMRTLVVVFVLALISIAFEVYSDAALTSVETPHGAPDPVTMAIAHGLKRG
jgi:hypothetical protein